MKRTIKEVLEGYLELKQAAEECKVLNINPKQAIAMGRFLKIRDNCGKTIPKYAFVNNEKRILFAAAFDLACGRKELEDEAEDFEEIK